MSRPTDADVEMLPVENLDLDQQKGDRPAIAPAAHRWEQSIWDRAPVAKVSLPKESFFFAIEPAPPVEPKDPKKPALELKPGQALLQFQRWMPFVKLSGFDEPVGDWVVSDVVVTRGQNVGGKQFVNLPLWSSEFNRYILRELPETKKTKEPPKRGVMMDPATAIPSMLVVEVEGGKQSPRINGKIRDDDSAFEILLMREDGRLEVHKSEVERQDPTRMTHEKSWKEWVDRIDKVTSELIPTTDMNPTPKGRDNPCKALTARSAIGRPILPAT